VYQEDKECVEMASWLSIEAKAKKLADYKIERAIDNDELSGSSLSLDDAIDLTHIRRHIKNERRELAAHQIDMLDTDVREDLELDDGEWAIVEEFAGKYDEKVHVDGGV
jgi:hypothetical protein